MLITVGVEKLKKQPQHESRADFQNEKVEISKKLTLKEELLIILPGK